jgi:hypothetical protein
LYDPVGAGASFVTVRVNAVPVVGVHPSLAIVWRLYEVVQSSVARLNDHTPAELMVIPDGRGSPLLSSPVNVTVPDSGSE